MYRVLLCPLVNVANFMPTIDYYIWLESSECQLPNPIRITSIGHLQLKLCSFEEDKVAGFGVQRLRRRLPQTWSKTPVLEAQTYCPPHIIIYCWKALNVYFPMPLEAHHLELYSSSYTPSKVQRSVGLTTGCHHVCLCSLRGSFLPQF